MKEVQILAFEKPYWNVSRQRIAECFFLIALIIWVSWYVARSSFLMYLFPDETTKVIRVVCMILLAMSQLSMLGKTTPPFSMLVVVICLAVTVITVFFSTDSSLIDPVLFVFCSRVASCEKIFKTLFTVSILSCAVIVGLGLAGIIPDYVWDPTTRQRHGLGFLFCTTAPHLLLGICLCWAMTDDRRRFLPVSAILGVAVVMIFLATDTKSPFILSLIVLMVGAINHSKALRIPVVVGACIAALPYIVFPVAILFLSYTYTADSEVYNFLNKVLTYRLSFSHESLLEYGSGPFGVETNISTSVLGADGQLVDETGLNTNHLDSSFVRIYVVFGWLALVLTCSLFFSLGMRAARARNGLLCALLLVNAIRALFDPQLLMIQYDCLLFLLVPHNAEDWLSKREKKNE